MAWGAPSPPSVSKMRLVGHGWFGADFSVHLTHNVGMFSKDYCPEAEDNTWFYGH